MRLYQTDGDREAYEKDRWSSECLWAQRGNKEWKYQKKSVAVRTEIIPSRRFNATDSDTGVRILSTVEVDTKVWPQKFKWNEKSEELTDSSEDVSTAKKGR